MIFYYALFILQTAFGFSNPTDCETETMAFQEEWNQYFADSARTPLEPQDFANFKSLPFFDFAPQYCVPAVFKPAEKEAAVTFQTTTGQPRTYFDVGQLHFEIDGEQCQLTVYQNAPTPAKRKKKKQAAGKPLRWFLPFKDLTNGATTYGGGRYMDLVPVPAGATIQLNFNKCYPPLCAYSSRFSCPIVPEQNTLKVAINAGLAMETITK